MPLKLGIEVLKENDFKELSGKKVGLLSNPASVDSNFKLSPDIFLKGSKKGSFELAKLFGPQQGFFEVQQANMIEWEGNTDNPWSIPLFSLYGKTRKPDAGMLYGLDCMVIDLQDIGAKGYTFISTLYYIMEACEEMGIEVVVLDRPNPLGDKIEGPVTKEAFRSFVGIHNLPLRHGLTIGEIGRLFAKEVFPSLKFKVIKMKGYKKSSLFTALGREWVLISPNMPYFSTAFVYPGMELFEGTNISEARGTTRPFEQFGAPFIKGFDLCDELNSKNIKGAVFRPVSFLPTFDKYFEENCYGCFIHVTNDDSFSSVTCALEIIASLLKLYPGKLLFREPPYEYEQEKKPFDILIGNDYVRNALLKGKKVEMIEKMWQMDITHFKKRVAKIRLYK